MSEEGASGHDNLLVEVQWSVVVQQGGKGVSVERSAQTAGRRQAAHERLRWRCRVAESCRGSYS